MNGYKCLQLKGMVVIGSSLSSSNRGPVASTSGRTPFLDSASVIVKHGRSDAQKEPKGRPASRLKVR